MTRASIRPRSPLFRLLPLAAGLLILALFIAALGVAPLTHVQAQEGGTTTTIVDGGGGAKGFEPTNVQVVPGDGQVTVSWTVTSRPGVNDDKIWHAVRWSQTVGSFDNPGAPPNQYIETTGRPVDGLVLEPGVTSYTIKGLKNRMATGVHVRSFAVPSERYASAASSSHWVRVKGTATTPVADEVIFDSAGYSVAEGGTVSLGLSRYAIADASLNNPLTFTLATADGTAASSDYTAFSGRSVVMAANAAAATSNVVTKSDDLVEDDETLTVTISVPETSIFAAGNPATATVTIEDDDRASARIAFGSDAASTTRYTAAVDEADGTLSVPVTVSHLPGESTSFTVEVLSGGTATEGSDFSIAAKRVTFGPTTAKTQNLAITLSDDADYENDETIQLRIVAADNPGNDLGDYYARDAAGATAAITVGADPTMPPKSFAIPSAVSATEGRNTEITLTLGEDAPTGGLAFTVTPAYGTGAGKAAASDLTSLPTTIAVAENQRTATLSIPIAQDELVEGAETFTVTVTTAAAGWSVDSNRGNQATITIVGKDRETASIAFGTDAASTSGFAVTVAEAVTGGTLNVPVTVSHLPGESTTFAVEILDGGTATEDGDFSIAAKRVTFGPADSSKTKNIAITLIGDGDYEVDETIQLRIVAADDPGDDLGDYYARHAAGATATVTVRDEFRVVFGTDPGSTTKYAATVSEAVSGGTLNVPVTVSHLPAASAAFTIEVLGGGTATESSDFSIANRRVTFGPTTARTQNLAITLIDDGDYENDETIELRIAAADSPANDPGDHYVRQPSAVRATITITRNDTSAQTADDDQTTTTVIDGGGGAQGAEPTDVQVAPGDGELTVYWTVASRPGVDDDEIYHALRWSQTYGVYDNPGMPKWDPLETGNLLPIHGILIEPGVSSYTITGLKNRVVTGVHVRSFTGASRSQSAAASSHWVRVKGADTTPVANEVTFDDAEYSVAEGGTVRLGLSRYGAADTFLDDPLTVTLTTADGGAGSSDYTGFSSRSVAMAANASTAGTSVVTTADELVEEDETLTVTLSLPEGSVFGAGDPLTARITIQDDDRASARIAFGASAATTSGYAATVAEDVTGGTLNVPVTVSHLPGKSTTFAVQVLAAGTATEGSDFSIAVKRVTFSPTDASKTKNIVITLSDDADYELDEIIQLRIVAADSPANDLGDHYARHAAGATAAITVTSEDERSATKTYAVSSTVSVPEGGNAELSLTLGEAAPEGGLAFTVTANYASAADNQASASDTRDFRSATHTVPAGQTSSTIRIPTRTDYVVENDETFTVSVAARDARWSPATAGADTSTVTIRDADQRTASVAFGNVARSSTKYTATLAESAGGSLVLPVSISRWGDAPVTFTVEILDTSTATEGSDFRIATKTVTFDPQDGGQTRQLRIAPIDDQVFEKNETIELRIAPARQPAVDLVDRFRRHDNGATATITITSADSNPLSVSPTSLSLKPGGTAEYTVVLTTEPTHEVTITPTSGATNRATVSGPLTFTKANWRVPQKITVTGVAPGAAAISHAADSDDQRFPSSLHIEAVEVTVTKHFELTSAVTASEGAHATLTVTLNDPAPNDMTFTVGYVFSAQTATLADIGANRPLSVTVRSGQTTAALNVPIAHDSVIEANETFKLSITPGRGVTGEWSLEDAGADTATVTIADATIGISVGQASLSVDEGAGTVNVPITFSNATPELLTVGVTLVSGSATATADFKQPASGSLLSVPKGTTTINYSVPIVDDSIREQAETFSFRLWSSSIGARTLTHGYQLVNPIVATITINDNDTAGVTVSGSPVAVREGSTATYTVTLKSKPTANVRITPTSDDTSKARVSGAVVFTPADWNQPKSITVTGVAEGTATISHRASSGDSFYSNSLSIDSAAVTVAPYGVYGIASTAAASEGGNAELAISLSKDAPAGGLEFTVTPTYSTGAGKAAAADLNSPPSTIKVAANQRSATLSIPIARDALVEGAETFTVTIATSGAGWSKRADHADTATVTITDLTRTVSLAKSSYTVGESDGKVAIGLAVSGSHTDTITATLTLTDGSAILGADYGSSSSATTVQVSFASGETSATLNIPIRADALAEGAETFTVAITAVSAGHAIHSSSNAATVNVTDDDSAQVKVSPTTLSIQEYGAGAVYAVVLGAKPTADVTVTPASSSKTNATAGDPVTFTPKNWNEPQQIRVSPIQEGSVTISHTVTSDDAVYAALTPDSVAVTVTPYPKTYAISRTVTGLEGGSALVRITLGEPAPFAGLTFGLDFGFGDPASDKAEAADLRDGFLLSTPSTTVSAGETERTISIPIIAGDLLGEADETFTVSITSVSSEGSPATAWKQDPGGAETSTVTIQDRDAQTAKVAFGSDAAAATRYTVSVAENVAGGTLNVPVTVSHLPAKATKFKIEASGSATAYTNDDNPGDYRIAEASVTFGPSDSSKTKNVVISLIDDSDVETAETIALRIAAVRDPLVDLSDHYARDANGAAATITVNSDDLATGSTKTYALAPAATAREGEDAELTVTLGEAAPQGGVSFAVSYDYSGGSAAKTDLGKTPATLTIAAGSRTGTISVPIKRDEVEEDSETFSVTITASTPGWGRAPGGGNTATVTIADTTEEINFSAGAFTVIEGEAANVVVTRTGSAADAVQVNVSAFGFGPLARGLGYVSRTASFLAGAQSATAVFDTVDNQTVQASGRLTIWMDDPPAGSGYILGDNSSATLVIVDDDSERYTRTFKLGGDVEANEGANAKLAIILGEAAHEDGLEFTVSYDYSGGSATADDVGDDAPATLSVTAGSTEATLSIPIAQDSDDDDNETFVVSITPASGDSDWTLAPSGAASATVTINNVAGSRATRASMGPVSFGSATIGNKSFTVGASAPYPRDETPGQERHKLPAAVGGDFGVSYSATGLPEGLVLGPDRIIRGTPTEATTSPVTVTYTATRGDGEDASTASLTFQVTVHQPVTFDPQDLYPFVFGVFEYTVGQATPFRFQFPEASGGDGDLTYHLDHEKPRTPISKYAEGLKFDDDTRVLSSGVGSQPPAPQSYALHYWAEDKNGSKAFASGAIEVNGPPALPEIDDQKFAAGADVSIALPAASGGSTGIIPLRYSLQPDVPGLTFDRAARTLSGVATAIGSTTLSYTATDRNGVSDTETFTLTVTAGSAAPASAPTSVETEQLPGTTNFIVSWEEMSDATEYAVQVAAEGDDFQTDRGISAWPEGYLVYVYPGQPQALVAVPAYGRYAVRVAGVNASGPGPWAKTTANLEELQEQPVVRTYSITPAVRVVEGPLVFANFDITLSEPAPASGLKFTVTHHYSSSASPVDVKGSGEGPWQVTVRGRGYPLTAFIRDDDIDEDDETFTVTIVPTDAEGWELAGSGRDTATITIVDNDTAGVTLTADDPLSVSEDGTATYTVVLQSQPTSAVTITPTSDDPGAAAVSPASHTIAPADWNVPVTFTVSGAADDDSDDEGVGVSHLATSDDPKYAGIVVATVAVSVTDTTPPEVQESEFYSSEPVAQQSEQQEPAGLPGPVLQLELTATPDSVTVSWNAPQTGDAPNRYIAHLRPEGGKTGSGKTKNPKASKTTVTFPNLEAGKTYKVWVRAQNQVGKGERVHAVVTLPEEAEQEPGDSSPQEAAPPNHAPTVVAAVADGAIVHESGTLWVSLSGVFGDADNDPLTISASSSNEDLATVSVAPDLSGLTVTARARGVATITVTAEDGAGGAVSDTFVVTVKAAPAVASPLADLSGLEPDATQEVSLSGVFRDADGDGLTITVASSDETIATVSVASDHSSLTVAGVAVGTATITVVAQDSDGNRISDAFDVTVARALREIEIGV